MGDRGRRAGRIGAAIALVVATIAAYAPAMRAPFELDDLTSIPGNPSIRRLWPLAVPLSPPANTTVAGRPVVNVSLALNYAVNQWLRVDQRLDPFGPNKTVGFHLTNVLLHLVCGMLLFGVIRRTLRRESWSGNADGTAALVTAIWLLHPLQSEAVAYAVQRTELLVSACYLGTLYSSIRAWDATGDRARAAWKALAVVVCLLGMGSKEVMLTAPFIVVLYDRAFRVGSWRELVASRARVVFYLLLAATSGWTIYLMTQNARAGTVGFHAGVSWYRYLYSQAWAVSWYLRLAFLPDRLTFDYGQRPIAGARGVPGVIVLSALAFATVAAWIRLGRWRGWALLGAWFFLLLAPSSSVVPIATEIAAERRIYLAFAAVVVAVVIVASALWRRAPRRTGDRSWMAGWSAILVVLAATTFARSRAYANPEALWRDTVRKAPANPRAYNNLASALFFANPPRLAEAKELYWQAIALDSTYLPPWSGLASVAVNEGRPDEAKWLLEQALAKDPEYADAVDQLGRLYLRQGQPARAAPYLERFATAYPSERSLMALATAYLQTGRLDAAAVALRDVLAINPSRADALRNLGGLLTEQGRGAEAIPLLERAAAIDAQSGVTIALLSVAYAEAGRADDASRAGSVAVERAGDDASVYVLVGRAMLVVHRAQEARALLARAVQLGPDNPEAVTRLGFAERELGNDREAERLFRRAIQLDSTYEPVRKAIERKMKGR